MEIARERMWCSICGRIGITLRVGQIVEVQVAQVKRVEIAEVKMVLKMMIHYQMELVIRYARLIHLNANKSGMVRL